MGGFKKATHPSPARHSWGGGGGGAQTDDGLEVSVGLERLVTSFLSSICMWGSVKATQSVIALVAPLRCSSRVRDVQSLGTGGGVDDSAADS